jgi:hypothetical protein
MHAKDNVYLIILNIHKVFLIKRKEVNIELISVIQII